MNHLKRSLVCTVFGGLKLQIVCACSIALTQFILILLLIIKGPTGAQQAIAEYKRFKTPDNKKFEVFYYGPTGNGVNGKPIGCKMFFDKISFDKVDAESITTNVALFEQYMTARMGDASTRNLVVDQLVSFVSAFISAYTSPEYVIYINVI